MNLNYNMYLNNNLTVNDNKVLYGKPYPHNMGPQGTSIYKLTQSIHNR